MEILVPFLHSIKAVEKQYETGDRPVLVACSDKCMYICKYMHTTGQAYKLAAEFVGAQLAEVWQIASPVCAFVWISEKHWEGIFTSHNSAAPALGYRKINGSVDITTSTCQEIEQSKDIMRQLLQIALFDFWVANEDRTFNNMNLLYEVQTPRLISIDYGGIFNTSTFEAPMSQLMETDTILYADIFRRLQPAAYAEELIESAKALKAYYDMCVRQSQERMIKILDALPKAWNVRNEVVENKTRQLFNPEWIESSWQNFIHNVIENTIR